MHIASSSPGVSSVSRGCYVGKVIANESICRDHYRLTLRVVDFPPTHAGQFVQLQSHDPADLENPAVLEWSRAATLTPFEVNDAFDALLNRPFSLAGRVDDQDGVAITFIYRVVGAATAWLATLRKDRFCQAIGPLGHGFTPAQDQCRPILIGGGVGVPPMIYAASTWGRSRAVAFCGAMSRDLLSLTIDQEPDPRGLVPTRCIREFSEADVPTVITSDDGSIGRRGFVTDALVDWLATHRDEPSMIYACGPEPMLKRIAEIAVEFAVPCEVAVERAMACGLGTCQSCVIRVRDGDGWKYKLACTDGPVFDAATLLW